MNTSFKYVLTASVVMYSIAFLPIGGLAVPIYDKEVTKDVMLGYIILGDKFEEAGMPGKAIVANSAQPPRIELNKNIEFKSAMSQASVKVKRETGIKSTKDYIDYYQFIREKIRQHLKANYKAYRSEGDVRLIFSLNCHGMLLAANIDDTASTSDPVLRDITVASTAQASPFPAFPKALSLPEMSFDVVVSFRKE